MTGYRLPEGGLVDRSKELKFQFDGEKLSGFQGDTLASALLAMSLLQPTAAAENLARRSIVAEPHAVPANFSHGLGSGKPQLDCGGVSVCGVLVIETGLGHGYELTNSWQICFGSSDVLCNYIAHACLLFSRIF